jgi:hypothetical protein
MPFTGDTSAISTMSTTATVTSSMRIWTQWNTSYVNTFTVNSATSATTSFASNETIWLHWNSTATSITITPESQNQVWSAWSAPLGESVVLNSPENAELTARLVAETKRRRDARAIAIRAADELLFSVLNEVQRQSLAKNAWFLVKGKSGKGYRLRKGRAGNVDEIDPKTGVVLRTLCAHPSMDVPDGDTVAAQKLMLETDDEEFFRIANKRSGLGGAVPSELLALLH